MHQAAHKFGKSHKFYIFPPLRFLDRDTQMHTKPIYRRVCMDAHISGTWALGCFENPQSDC